MSTKIYNGIKLPNMSVFELNEMYKILRSKERAIYWSTLFPRNGCAKIHTTPDHAQQCSKPVF